MRVDGDSDSTGTKRAGVSGSSDSKLEERRRKQRDRMRRYLAKPGVRDRINAQRKQPHRMLAQKAAECRYLENARKRGVDLGRLRPPRTLARAAAVLRWRATLQSTNGSWSGDSSWDSVMLWGEANRLRARDRYSDLQSSSGPGAKWLKDVSRGTNTDINTNT